MSEIVHRKVYRRPSRRWLEHALHAYGQALLASGWEGSLPTFEQMMASIERDDEPR